MKFLKYLLFATPWLVLPTFASTLVEEVRTVGNTSRITIESKVLKENRRLLIHVPNSYAESNKAYPVLYLLDGERHFDHAIIAVQLLQKQKRVPELIIVAITNKGAWGNDGGIRQRDLGYEKENFTRYIENEVLHYVNHNYRTTGLNTLFGHSLAGYYSTDLLANHPKLFKNYIAASPVIQGDEVSIYKKLSTNLMVKDIPEKSLYFSLASGDEARRKAVTDAINLFAKLLTESAPEILDWQYEFFDNQTHSTIYYPTLFTGMTHVFSSYQDPHFANYQEYLNFGGMEGMKTHYKKRGQIYGTDLNIPENTLLNLAGMLLTEGKTADALQLYSTLTNNFPESARSFSGLGEVYNALKKFDKSLIAHQTAVELSKKQSPEWRKRIFQSRLEKVQIKAAQLN